MSTPLVPNPSAAATTMNISSSSTPSKDPKSSSTTIASTVLKLVLFVVNTILCLAFAGLVVAFLAQHLYEGPITELKESYERRPDGDMNGFFTSLMDDITYYNRQCTGPEDISTDSNNDLMVPVGENNTRAFREKVREISMTHGALLIPNVLKKDTAQKLRDYLETNYHALDEVPYSANFWSEMSRLSLGLTIDKKSREDDVLVEALTQVGANPHVKHSLEAMLGPNPAIVELSTLTTMYKARAQGIHTDSDYFGSSLLYSRTFLHSYTMFMALQDTTPRMGATTVCPGTHMCANDDLSWLCGDSTPHAFEASSNGKTGKDVGLFYQGDAFLFNQNVWHRGPPNRDPNHPNENRVMFIMTFVSRRDYDAYRDTRQLGWGTYYYMRWDQWGHTFRDLKHAADRFTTWGTGSLRALGLAYFGDVKKHMMGYTWVEHFARQLATDEDFYAHYELPAFKKFLKETLELPDWLLGREKTKQWEKYFSQMAANAVKFAQDVELKVLAGGALLYLLLLLFCTSHRRAVGGGIAWLVVGHALIALTGWSIYQAIMHSYLGEKIAKGQIWDTAFPKVGDEYLDVPRSLPSTVPERMDVLVGTRFDAQFLGSFNDMLEYHPGNKHLKKIVKRFATSSLPLKLAEQGVRETWTEVPIYNVLPRMLLQDYATGDWGIMKEGDVETTIRRMLLAGRSTVIMDLWTHLKEVLADGRFGQKRETAMGRVFTQQFVDHWQDVVFDIKEKEDEAKLKLTLSKTSDRPMSIPAMVQTTISTVAEKPPTIVAMPARRRLHATADDLLKPQKDISVLDEGDRVIVRSTKGSQDEAVIRFIYDEDECLVQFVGDDKTKIMSTKLMQPYVPLVEGDLVEVEFEGGWYRNHIHHVSAFAHYYIQWEGTSDFELVERHDIRLQAPSSGSSLRLRPHSGRRPALAVGQHVFVNYKQSGDWFPGRIIRLQDGGASYFIQFDDGDLEQRVRPEFVLPMYMHAK